MYFDYRILCWNCNAARGLYGVCPHIKREVDLVLIENGGKYRMKIEDILEPNEG